MAEVEPFAASLVQYDRKGQVASSKASRSDLDKYLGLFELRSPLVYKATLIEFIATLLNVFTSCAVVISSIQYGFSVPPLLIAIAHIIILGFFILASAKASGGHMNPMISFATMVAGLTTPARAVLYILAQMAGAVCGAGLLKAVLDAEPFGLGGCSLGTLSVGRALIAEAVGSCVLLFIAFGTALDTGQREVFGPVLGPFFVSITVALIIFFGGGLVTGCGSPCVRSLHLPSSTSLFFFQLPLEAFYTTEEEFADPRQIHRPRGESSSLLRSRRDYG